METKEHLTLQQLRAAAQAGGVSEVTLEAAGAEFQVAVSTQAGGKATLVTTRDRKPRRFGSLDKAAQLLHELGIQCATLDVSHWDPDAERGRRRRPDRAEALKRAHEAADYDRWFRAKVEEALAEADDPNIVWTPHEQVMAELDEIIARAQRRHRAG